jgi:transcriptional regulator with XRE-family HTH domain
MNTSGNCCQPPDCADFVKELRRLVSQKDWTEGRLARASGLDGSRVSRLLNGLRRPTLEQVFRFSVAMALTRKETNTLLDAAGFLPCPDGAD